MLRVAEHWSGTDTGLQRRANEDSMLVRSPLFVVADGMGGAQAGEVASRLAVDTFKGGLADGSDPEASLLAQVEQANTRINELSHANVEHAGMGTTITAVYLGEQDLVVAHVGDSRAYCLREGELLRLTDDHSLVDELIRQGKLTPEEAEEHPQRSVITRALGPEAAVEVDVRTFRARPGDVYLLCSDGLTTMLAEAELLGVLASNPALREAGEQLILAANAAGGKDNITVILLRVEEAPAAGESAEEDHTTMTSLAPAAVGAAGGAGDHGGGGTSVEAASLRGASSLAPPTIDSRAPVVPRRPRRPESRPQPSRGVRMGRRLRRLRAPLIGLVTVGLLAAGAYLALQSVYFIGTNQRGLVTMFSGLPYELPGKVKLYSSDYVSGVSAATMTSARRQELLDHSLLSESKAAELMRQLELGELSGG
ncbi:MAG: Stp1/IreP family PP2C-type Ser/Thr phosphatase [Solirubrobacteraceae bacterium]